MACFGLLCKGETGPRAPGRAKGPNGEETIKLCKETTGGVACEPDGAAAAPCGEKRSLSALAVPDSQILIWRVLLGDRIGADELLINISPNQLLAEGRRRGIITDSSGDPQRRSMRRAERRRAFQRSASGDKRP
ncbi:unnamed protein product [Gadus morhua 'NCC']